MDQAEGPAGDIVRKFVEMAEIWLKKELFGSVRVQINDLSDLRTSFNC